MTEVGNNNEFELKFPELSQAKLKRFWANCLFQFEVKKVTSQAELKILQLSADSSLVVIRWA